MNANLFAGKADAEDVVDAVRREHVDVLVVEEITPDELGRLDAAGLAGLLPNRVGEPDPDVAGTMVFSNEQLGAPALLGRTSHDLKRELGAAYEREVVHRDDLVLL